MSIRLTFIYAVKIQEMLLYCFCMTITVCLNIIILHLDLVNALLLCPLFHDRGSLWTPCVPFHYFQAALSPCSFRPY